MVRAVHAMRYLYRTLLGILLCLPVAGLPAAAGAGSGARRPPTMSELKRKANQAVGRYDRAQAVLARVENDIARLEREVGRLEADVAPLRAAVTRRAVAAYQRPRGLDAIAGLGVPADPFVSARGARIVAQASRPDLATIASLAGSTARLREQQQALEARRREQRTVMEQIGQERRAVELELAMMVRSKQDLQARVVENPRVASGRASRGGRDSAPAPAVDPASIPVATDFVCPIRGPVAFGDTWGAARSGGRRHKGTDMMSPHGTDNVAVVSGAMERRSSGAGGITVYLHGDDGTTYMYMHLSQVVGENRRVAQGEVIGKTGATGNARGGSPHTHFEIHPGGAAAVNPYPTVAAHC